MNITTDKPYMVFRKEIWKPIKDYEELYEVSNLGNVRSVDRYVNAKLNGVLTKRKIEGTNIKPYLHKTGYYIVKLSKNGKRKNIKIHRLVAEAFIDNPNKLKCINHKDENKLNNYVENLEWCSYKYNNNYGTKKERISQSMFKKVCQYTVDGKFIKIWDSIKEAQKYYKTGNISAVCKNKRKTTAGYVWKYMGN